MILLGSQNRKTESKMAVAKRQRKERPKKMNGRKSEDQSENLRWNKQPSWLAHFTHSRLGGEETYTQRSQTEPLFFWVGPPYTSRMYVPLLTK